MAAVKSKSFRYKNNSEIIEYAAHLVEQLYIRKRRQISNTKDSQELIRAKLAHLDREVFAVLFLDNRHRVIAFEKLFLGTINATAVYPREIARAALKHNAAGVILAHNHPSADPSPSHADRHLTSRIKEVLDLIAVRVVDHVIVAGHGNYSFSEKGIL